MLVVGEPRPLDLVCPDCGQIVRRSNSKQATSSMQCPRGHGGATSPITYARWLGEAALVEIERGR